MCDRFQCLPYCDCFSQWGTAAAAGHWKRIVNGFFESPFYPYRMFKPVLIWAFFWFFMQDAACCSKPNLASKKCWNIFGIIVWPGGLVIHHFVYSYLFLFELIWAYLSLFEIIWIYFTVHVIVERKNRKNNNHNIQAKSMEITMVVR